MARLLAVGITGIAAPSANRFGRVSPTSAAHVRADLGDDVPVVLEGGDAEIGVESTIVDLSRGRAVLLRPGHIGAEAIAAVLGEPVAAPDARGAEGVRAACLRTMRRRRALRLVQRSQLEAALAQALAAGQRVALWSRSPPPRHDPLVSWYPQPESAAVMEHDLYRMLRELDAAGAQLILVQAPPDEAAWAAVNDRLKRAAAPR